MTNLSDLLRKKDFIDLIRSPKESPDYDAEEEKRLRKKDEKKEVSRSFYCHGCNSWQSSRNDFDPYDCPNCGKSRWGD